jgi:hypothetical protein
MSARTDLSGGYQADWYPYRDPPTAGASEFYPNLTSFQKFVNTQK